MAANDYYELGTYTRKVTTDSAEGQLWFDRGLLWSYGFNHEEGAACFERAVEQDHTCAMAYWGLAYSLGPNYNKPWEFFDSTELNSVVKRTHEAVLKAQEHAASASAVERALIDALVFRYPVDHTPDASNCAVWNKGYADAMMTVYRDFPSDLDVAALYADSLMNLTPWALWDLRTGEPQPEARTLDAKAVLDRAIASPGGDIHPGLLHLYIHLMEMSQAPEKALPVADRLRGLVPDAGHLQHMPTHLDVLCGDWKRAIVSNSHAVTADEKFLAKAGPKNFYTLYRTHNYHFKIYAAMFAGKQEVALETVAQLEASMPDELLRIESPPMADWLEGFLAIRAHVLVRFGMWEDILKLEIPSDTTLCCTVTAITHHAQAIAYANTNDLDRADHSRSRFKAAVNDFPSSRTLFNNTCMDILAVADAMLDGEVDFRQGDFEQGLEHLRRAIKLSDTLPYDEPWGWLQPPRHTYGALLLERADHLAMKNSQAKEYIEEAATVYGADLGFNDTLPRALQHPKNVWALSGYCECMERLGRSNTTEATQAAEQLRSAVADTDVPIASSCLCRKRGL